MQHAFPIHPTTLVKWRQRVGDKRIEALLSESVRLAVRQKKITPHQLSKVTVDTTVQEKAVAYPTDARLLYKAARRLAKLAAERMTPDDAHRLRCAIERSAKCVDDRRAWHQHDLQFHLEVARLAGNSVLGGALHTIMAQVLKVWSACPERFDPQKSIEGHRAIVESLASGDADSAAARMRRHLDAFERAARLRPLRVSA